MRTRGPDAHDADMSDDRRFTGRQLMVMFVAACLTLVLVPWGSWAAGKQVVAISGKGGKQVAVTKDRALKVGDGSGPLTVDGQVGVSGRVGVDGTVTVQAAGKPVQAFGSVNSAPAGGYLLGHGTVAVTDAVLSQTNTGTSRLNLTVSLRAGNADCSVLTGPQLGRIVEYSYLPAETILPLSLTTPVVATADNVCLALSLGSPAGLFFSFVVNGVQL